MKRRLRLLFLRVLALLARPFVRPAPPAVSRILYVKPDHLGDLLLATPALAALRQRFPSARIAGLVGPWSLVVLQHNPAVDVVLTCPFPGFARQPATDDRRPTTTIQNPTSSDSWSLVLRLSSLIKPYRLLLRYALLLRAGRYDLAIVGRDDHWWGAALALLAGIPWRVGYAVPECRPFLSDALPWNPRAHVTAQGLALVEAAAAVVSSPLDSRIPTSLCRRSSPRRHRGHGEETIFLPSPWAPCLRGLSISPSKAARFEPRPEERRWADEWLRAHADGDAPLVAIHPGTGGPAKLWFPERWAAVADALQAAGVRLLLTGGPGEQALVAEIARGMRVPALALVGQTTVGQLAALFSRAALVIGVDSGPLHLAAAQATPTLHLYGPGDAGRFGPWGDPARHVVVRTDLWCSPCGVFSACPRGLARPECMARIEVARVVAQARRLLDAQAA